MISLRRARLDDHWRRAYRRKYPLEINSIKLVGGDIFDGLELSPKPGINAIVGKNGTGKSNFLRTVFNSLAADSSNRSMFNNLLDQSNLELAINIQDTDDILTLSPNDDEPGHENISCFLFDSCSIIPEIQNLFHNQENLEELIEGFSVINLSQDELKIINFLTNSKYDDVQIVNIEDEFKAFPRLPYFIVTRNGVNYDSRAMGLGELSLLYLYWIIEHIKKEDKHCILLIEEPESFLPPLIQERLCDILAMVSDTIGNVCLISTHSEHILKRVPRSHIHMMKIRDSTVKFDSVIPNPVHMKVLGLTAPKKGVLFYEDEAAKLFLIELIRFSPLYVSDSFYYHKSGSDGDVIKDLERFPIRLDNFKFLGVCDGDCKINKAKELEPFDNYVFLPTELSPEEILIPYIESMQAEGQVEEIASFIGTESDLLNAALEVAAGSDHHDYFIELSGALDLSYTDVFSKLSRMWIIDESNRELVDQFHSDLHGKIGA